MPRKDPHITVTRIYEPDPERMVRALRIFLGLGAHSHSAAPASMEAKPARDVFAPARLPIETDGKDNTHEALVTTAHRQDVMSS